MSGYETANFTLKNSTSSTLTLEDPNGTHQLQSGETSPNVVIDSNTVIFFDGESLEQKRIIFPLEKVELEIKLYKMKEGDILKRKMRFKVKHSDRPKDLNVEIIDPVPPVQS